MRRAGLTLLEVALALTIVGTVAAVAVPKLEDMERRAVAVRILGDVEAVRLATYAFFSDSGYFPVQPEAGTIPVNLEPYLPSSFTFQRPEWTISWELWRLQQSPTFVKNNVSVGVSVVPADPRVGATAMMLYRTRPTFVMGQKYTFMIVGG